MLLKTKIIIKSKDFKKSVFYNNYIPILYIPAYSLQQAFQMGLIRLKLVIVSIKTKAEPTVLNERRLRNLVRY